MSVQVTVPPSNPFSNLVIRASAGTGKTFQLSNRYLQLLDHGVPADRILATTFTRKAAGEILDRIVQRLATASQDGRSLQDLRGFLGNPELSHERCRELLGNLLRNLHRLRIGTLDSLFVQLARALSLEIGFSPNWEIIDELQEEQLRGAAIAQVLRQESTGEVLRLAHLLAKGETRRGVGQLVRQTVRDLHALFQESDARAWHALPHLRQMESAALEALLDLIQQADMPNKHMTKARDGDLEQARTGNWDELIDKGLAAKILAGEQTYNRQRIPDEVIRLYLRLLDHVRAVIVTRTALQTEGSYELLHKYDTARQRIQGEQGGLRFDDVTHRLDEALSSSAAREGARRPAPFVSAADLAHRLDSQIDHLLLDEFQDTSPCQWRVLRPFVDRSAQNNGRTSFFCVGDVKQAIYGWRGGVAEIFDAIEQHVPHLHELSLATSFRSSQPIMDTVNQVFSGIARHDRAFHKAPATLDAWRNGFQPHSTTKRDMPGYACLRTSRAPRDNETPDDAVLDSAADLVATVSAASPELNIGVLTLTNQTVAKLIHLLRKRQIRASEEGGNPLTDSAAVQLLLSVLRIADHPGDTVARFHLATSPLASFARLPTHRDDDAARRLSAELRERLLHDGYGRVLETWSAELQRHVGTRDRSRLRQLVEQAYLYQARATLRTDDFVRQVEFQRMADPLPAAVRVMTVFQAKGLEFDLVVLPELDGRLSGQTPSFVVERPHPTAPVTRVCRYVRDRARQLFSGEIQDMFTGYANQEMGEAMCVLYVALTRAIHSLHMLIAPAKLNSDSLPQTFAGLLRASLAHDQAPTPDSTLYQTGDPQWLTAVPKRSLPPSDRPLQALSPGLPDIIAVAASEHRRRGLPRVSPSGLEGGRLRRLATQLDPESPLAQLRGTVVHAWFQRIQWLEDGVPDDPELRSIAEELTRHARSPVRIDEWLSEFRDMLRHPEIERRLRRKAYGSSAGDSLVVETERAFAVPDSDGLLSGSIDRLVTTVQKGRIQSAEIVDFKTDRLRDKDEAGWQARIEYYRPQMEAYRRAVAVLTSLPVDRISGSLLFVSERRSVKLF